VKVSFSSQAGVNTVANTVDVLRYFGFSKWKGSEAQQALLGTANTDWQDEIFQTANN
jgi:iron complex outermembrane receptor protein